MTSGFASIRSVHLAFGSAFAILLALGVFSCRSIAASADSVGWVGHTYEVRERLQNMQLAMEFYCRKRPRICFNGDGIRA